MKDEVCHSAREATRAGNHPSSEDAAAGSPHSRVETLRADSRDNSPIP